MTTALASSKVLKLNSSGNIIQSILNSSGFNANPKLWDVVIVGGGHNGLVSAAYCAKSGLKTAVFERRPVIGGAAVTEEIIPGFKFSRASYVLSLLRPTIIRELRLKENGLKVHIRNPSSFTPIKNNATKSLLLGSNEEKNFKSISQFSKRDAENYAKYETMLQRYVKVIELLLDQSPPPTSTVDLSSTTKLKLLRSYVKTINNVRREFRGLDDLKEFSRLLLAPASQILDEWFESEPLKATLATDSVIGAMISPDTPGSGYVLLHHVMGEIDGIKGAWGYPEGGMGAVSNAIAKSALDAGAEIFVDSPVTKIECSNNKNVITLANGLQVESKIVLSNATPKVTRGLLGLKAAAAEKIDFKNSNSKADYLSGVTKINVAVDKLPNFTCRPNSIVGNDAAAPMPWHRCTIHLNCENSRLINEAYNDATVYGRMSQIPMIEMTIPSSLDKTLAPPGKHVCLFFVQYTPYDLDWNDDLREEIARRVFVAVDEYAPGFSDSIIGKEVLSPVDLERIFGLTGGNIFHGSMSLDKLYFNRTDTVGQVIICGSGAHPGGGVMGSPGRLAAIKAVQKLGIKWKFSV